MATYAIGDIQGCFDPFRRLLDRIRFDPKVDRLWLTGDLVNRGPGSLEVLRFVVEHDESIVSVLGNHDVYLLQRYLGVVRTKTFDTLQDVLRAPDVSRLMDWLRRRPLVHRDGPYLMVHAGLLSSWSAEEAVARSTEASRVLTGPHGNLLLAALRHDGGPWPEEAGDLSRLRETFAVMTRARMLDNKGGMREDFTGSPEDAPSGLVAWFDAKNRKTAGSIMVFGHWAALGLRIRTDILALDSGCVWGQALSAVRLEDRAVFQEPSDPSWRPQSVD